MTIERTLHHFTLDPASRQVRLAMAEKRLHYREALERYWERPESLAALNPSGLTPVLVENRHSIPAILSFYMGRNTPERRQYIMDNLVVDAAPC